MRDLDSLEKYASLLDELEERDNGETPSGHAVAD